MALNIKAHVCCQRDSKCSMKGATISHLLLITTFSVLFKTADHVQFSEPLITKAQAL